MKNKLNCWEFMNCGREPGGRHSEKQGICLASISRLYDGVNNGKCAGRYCWGIPGTLCQGKIQGLISEKLRDCAHCDFFNLVTEEEGKKLVLNKARSIF